MGVCVFLLFSALMLGNVHFGKIGWFDIQNYSFSWYVSPSQGNITNALSRTNELATIFFCSLNWTNMNDTNRLQMYKVQPKEKNQQQKTLGKYKRSDNTRSLCVQFAHFCWIFNSYLIRTFAQNAPHFLCYGCRCWMHRVACVWVICIYFDSFVVLQIHSLMGTDATFRKRPKETMAKWEPRKNAPKNSLAIK